MNKSTIIAIGSGVASAIALLSTALQPAFTFMFSNYPDKLAISLKQIDHFSVTMVDIGELESDFDKCSQKQIFDLNECKKLLYPALLERTLNYFKRMPVAYVIMPDDLTNSEFEIFKKIGIARETMTCMNLRDLEKSIEKYIEQSRIYFDLRTYSKPGSFAVHSYRITFGVPACRSYSDLDYLKDLSPNL